MSSYLRTGLEYGAIGSMGALIVGTGIGLTHMQYNKKFSPEEIEFEREQRRLDAQLEREKDLIKFRRYVYNGDDVDEDIVIKDRERSSKPEEPIKGSITNIGTISADNDNSAFVRDSILIILAGGIILSAINK